MKTSFPTHDVFNQPEPLEPVNLFEIDSRVQAAVKGFGGDWGVPQLSAYGALAGGPLVQHARLANRYPPELKTFDTYGHRIDEVEFHPAYHELMGRAIEHGVHSLAWETQKPGHHVVRATLELLHHQAEAGTDCPLTMTFAAIPSLQTTPAIAEAWLPGILSRDYDASSRPYFEKRGLTIGMAMTEKQGGTDVRANTTRAVPLNQAAGGSECFELTGHKWFCSAPMSDAFLTLAYLDEGLSCFLLPRIKLNGERNAFHLQRLKDKIGNRSNASSEVEYDGAFAWLLGDAGRGVATIIQMVALTRFNCIVGSTAQMRQGVIQVLNHIRQRSVMGKLLIDQPLMRNVAADLVLESEAALWLMYRLARALEQARSNPMEEQLVRIGTAIGKYWVCKRAPAHLNEAQECLGGLGYIEDHPMARLYREAPLNSIWEGSGNVQCLDVLRALSRSPEVSTALLQELRSATGCHALYDETLEQLQQQLAQPELFQARALVQRMALLWQASLLHTHADPLVAKSFIQSRLGTRSTLYGSLDDTDAVDILLRSIHF